MAILACNCGELHQGPLIRLGILSGKLYGNIELSTCFGLTNAVHLPRSPFCIRGEVVDWLKTPEGAMANKTELVYGIASGLEYLHSRDIIHGVSLGRLGREAIHN